MKTKKLFGRVKQLFSIAVSFAILFLFTGCIFDGLQSPEDNNSGTGTTIDVEVTVRMPEQNPQTRISLTPDVLDVNLAWQTGDKIDLLVVADGTKTLYRGVEVTPDEGNPKKATFSLTLPSGSHTTFNMYGVYGGDGFSTVSGEEHLVVLPTVGVSTSANLLDIETNKAVVLTFSCSNIPVASPSVSASFEHLGSLFKISLKNTGTTELTGIAKAEFIASDGTTIHAHVNTGGAKYNIITPGITGAVSDPTSLPFELETPVNLASGDVLEFWGWYIPIEDIWPRFGLRLSADGGPYYTTNGKLERSVTTSKGKTYHFFATFDDSSLYFTNKDGVEDTGSVLDSRDINIYKTVSIGTQMWMAENLAYLPSVADPGTGSTTVSYYYVYDYNGTDITAAKATSNYQTYGVLYNWPAAMAEAASSNSNPSKVQGVCPKGWHLPSDAEWIQLETFLSNNGYRYDGKTGPQSDSETVQDKIAKSLASESGWPSDSGTGTVGNTDYPAYRNKSGFTALPGGTRFIDGTFNDIGSLGLWWSSTEYGTNYAWRRDLYYGNSYVFRYGYFKEFGFSVRCVKD